MQEKSKIIKTFKKISILKQHNHFIETAKISDADYDKLKKEIQSLEKKNSFLKELNLISKSLDLPPQINLKN